MKKLIVSFTVIICLAAFSLTDNSKAFKKLYALEGTWKMNGKRGFVYEEWKKLDKNNLQGRSYIIKTGDTVITENVQLTNNGGGIFYIPTVEDQNDRRPISFKMTRQEKKMFVFENPEHDFPRRIIYHLVNHDSLHVSIDDGTEAGKKQHFNFKRQ